MKQKSLTIAICVLIIINIISVIGWNKSIDKTNLYYNYYKATESFLDTLDAHYDWVDAFDPCDYYDAVEQIRNSHY